jgi:hypothetical protein
MMHHYRRFEARWALDWSVSTVRLMILTVGLAVSGGVVQFATPWMEWSLKLGIAWFATLVLCALVLLTVSLLRWPLSRESAVAVVVTGGILATASVGLDAKIRYINGLDGHVGYRLPHRPVSDHAGIWHDQSFQSVRLSTTDGVSLRATYWSRHKRRAIIYYPGWHTHRQAFVVVTMASWLSKEWDVLVLDPRGQGESMGVKSPSGDDAEDILAAIRFLRGNGCERIGVLAEQDGAVPALLAASRHQGIHSLALLAPTTTWGESLLMDGTTWHPSTMAGRWYWRTRAGLRLASTRTGGLDHQAILKRVAPTPILFCGSRAATQASMVSLYHVASEPKSAVLLGEAGIPCSWDEVANYHKTVTEWFKLTLRA